MSEIFEAVDEAFEEAFPPKPGGLVDRHRKRKAAEEEEENKEERIEASSYKAVKVAPLSPSVISVLVINIQPGQSGLILPLSMYRYRATVRIVTAASTVILGKDAGAQANGYTMITADQPLPVFSRAQLWAFNPGGAVVQVCVLSEIYAPEER